MRNKFFTRSAAAMMAAAMITTMAGSVPAFAARDTKYVNVVTIDKELHLDDENTAKSDLTLYAPNVTYTYTLSSASAGELSIAGAQKVPFANPETGDPNYTVDVDGIIVKAGSEATGLTVSLGDGTIAFSTADTITDPATGNESTGIIKHTLPITIQTDGTTMPGIYRFKIVESAPVITGTSDTVTGITHTEYNDTRYLDVFVGYADADGDGETTEIKYSVLFKLTNGSPIKTTGWVKDTNTPSTDLDEYLTEDVTLEKLIKGSLSDKTHRFPFEVALTGVVGSKFTYRLSAAGNSDVANVLAAGAFTDSYTNIKLKNKEKVTIYGLPNNATFKINEKNDTVDLYTVSATINGGEYIAEGDIAANATTTKADTTAITSATSASNVVDEVVFTNRIKEVSPTGIVFRFSQFLMITGIGCLFLFLILKKRQDDEDDASYSVA